MKRLTVYIADDHQIVIDGIALLLDSDADLIIVGMANNGEVAYEDILRLQPDIAIVDVRMPGKDGLQLIQTLRKKVTTKFIVLTMQMDKRILVDAEHFGAKGFLLKNSGKDELLKCIRKVANGEMHFPPMPKQESTSVLSPRELDILALVLKGLTTQQISEQLNLSPYTVETHRKNIYRKTDCNNVAMLMQYARENGLER